MSNDKPKNNSLSKKVSIKNLVKFTTPSIIMYIVMAFYTMVDGIFVARLVNTYAFAAVNIVYPMVNIVSGIGILLAAGGCAYVGKEMGEGKSELAKKHFSMIVYVGIGTGLVGATLAMIFINPLLNFLGASPSTFDYCYDYAFFLILFMPVEMLQYLFQYFFVVAGKPMLGMITTICAGVTNIALDYIFIGVFEWGIKGAAIATGIGFSIPAITGLILFAFNRRGTLYFVKALPEKKPLIKIFQNGSSEMVGTLAVSVTTILFNLTLLKYVGEDGVAAIGIILYVDYLLNAVYFGYEIGVSPLISYNYGEKNRPNLKKLLKMSLGFVTIASIATVAIANLFTAEIIGIFVKEGSRVYELTYQGLKLFSFAFLFMGLNIFTSAMFTALSNGKISAMIAFLRTFFLLSIMIIALPAIFGIEAIWLAVPVAELIAVIVSISFIIKYRNKYGYY